MTTFDIESSSSNLLFNKYKNVAKRRSNFNDSIVISKDSIKPGQLFSVKIEEVDQIYDGNLRIGFTILPDGILFPLARYSIPDMCERGGCWICAIDNEVEMEKYSQQELQSSFQFKQFQPVDGCILDKDIVQACKCCLSTSFGTVPLYKLMSDCLTNSKQTCESRAPGKVGSIISIYYDVKSVHEYDLQDRNCVLEAPDCIGLQSSEPCPNFSVDSICFKFTFHVLINGIEVNVHEDLMRVIPPDLGVFSSSDPYNYLPFVRAIVDVYGSTKSIQIIHFEQNKVKSLQDICVHEMIKNCGYEDMKHLPKSLKRYFQIQFHKLMHL